MCRQVEKRAELRTLLTSWVLSCRLILAQRLSLFFQRPSQFLLF